MLTTTTGLTADGVEQELAYLESIVARIRARQVTLVAVAGEMGLPALDGARSLREWTMARLDVTADTARALTTAARALPAHPDIARRLAAGEIGLDRAVLTTEVAEHAPHRVGDTDGYDLGGLRRLVTVCRGRTRRSDRRAFTDRYLRVRPSLEDGTMTGTFLLPGFDGHILLAALTERADRFSDTGGPRIPRPARMADALVSLAQDSIDPTGPGDRPGREPAVSVFIDAALAAPTRCHAGVTIAAGPRVGPDVVEELLCTGRIGVVFLTDGAPVSTTPTTRSIPPAIRRLVLHRDGGCTIEGCHSRYRLQPHHLRAYAAGGTHHPDNLTTLCWYHHHVIAHGLGHTIDPTTPPRRRRFHRIRTAHHPP